MQSGIYELTHSIPNPKPDGRSGSWTKRPMFGTGFYVVKNHPRWGALICKSGQREAMDSGYPGYKELLENLVPCEEGRGAISSRLAAILTSLGLINQSRTILVGLIELGMVKLDKTIIEAGYIAGIDPDTIALIKSILNAKPQDLPTFLGTKTNDEATTEFIEELLEKRIKEATCQDSPAETSASTTNAGPSPISS